MKKVININFQGRVIPIEETAYELLKQYVESLRKYFANEEGRDEIINDIEGRIAELFSERLKKGTICITDEDLSQVIASIGRPEDFAAEDAELGGGSQQQTADSQQQGGSQQQSQQYSFGPGTRRGRFFRNEDDKIIGGVASGLANYLGVDPVISRILFVVFFGLLFWVYILLWIIVPSKSIESNITKRLYRSADSKVIGGVAGGLAAYFNIDVWIPRLIFGLPLIVGVVSTPFGMWWNDWDIWWGPRILTGSLSGTLAVTYLILWITLPVATTASEKLEMRGEKVDINSISNKVKEDLGSFKTKAKSWGNEIKQSASTLGDKAKDMGRTAGSTAKTFASEAAPVARSAGSGIAHIIGILFKAFFLFIGGVIVLAILAAMAGMFGAGVMVMPFRNYFLDSPFQVMLSWSVLLLFFGVPLLAFLVWIIRKIAGSRKNPYIAYVFGVLWIVGLVSLIALIAGIDHNFRGGARIQNEVTLTSFNQPLTIKVAESKVRYYGGWMNFGDGSIRLTDDSLVLSNVRLKLEKSPDSIYHITYTRYSNGRTDGQAEELARETSYGITQWENTLYLDRGFSIPRGHKFRNQHILVSVQVPIGKRVVIDKSVNRNLNHWFSFGNNGRYWREWEWDNGESYWVRGDWNRNVEYIMTPGGVEDYEKMDKEALRKGIFRKIEPEENGQNREIRPSSEMNQSDSDKRYRYRRENKIKDTATITPADSTQTAARPKSETAKKRSGNSHENSIAAAQSPLYVFSRMFQQ